MMAEHISKKKSKHKGKLPFFAKKGKKPSINLGMQRPPNAMPMGEDEPEDENEDMEEEE